MFANLSARSLGVSGFSSELIELALSNRFRGLEVDLAELARSSADTGPLSPLRRLASARLELGFAELPVRWQQDDATFQHDLEALAAQLDAVPGCRRLTTTIEPACDERPYHENFEFHRRRLADLATVLRSRDARLGVGFRGAPGLREERPFEFIHDLDALLLLIRTVRDDAIGVRLSPWDIVASSGSLDDDLEKLSPSDVVTVEICDGPADVPPDQWTERLRLLPGETGAVDVQSVLSRLGGWKYDGPVTPCAGSDAVNGMRREEVVKLAGQRLSEFWKAAGLSSSGRLAPANH